MVLIENMALAKQIAQRVRPRSETIYGLAVILANDIAAISQITVSPEAVLNDGVPSPIPFTHQQDVPSMRTYREGKSQDAGKVLLLEVWSYGERRL